MVPIGKHILVEHVTLEKFKDIVISGKEWVVVLSLGDEVSDSNQEIFVGTRDLIELRPKCRFAFKGKLYSFIVKTDIFVRDREL